MSGMSWEGITTARTKAIAAADMREKAAAEDSLTQALKSLFAVMENYPVLKSNENVMELQEELVSTENKIAFSRQLYNDLVANLATKSRYSRTIWSHHSLGSGRLNISLQTGAEKNAGDGEEETISEERRAELLMRTHRKGIEYYISSLF